MKKYEKEILQAQIDEEKEVLEKLKKMYKDALDEINTKIAILLGRADSEQQYVIYQVQYQQALKKQIEAILETLHSNEFETVSEYLTKCYEDGYVSTFYSLQKQGIPLVMPMDQEQIVRAIQTESKLSENLYKSFDMKDLQNKIAGEISRGIAGGQMYSEIARNIAGYAGISLNKAMRVTRTEGHRIQCKATMDACEKAKSKGADVVKQWDSTLDKRTRKSHRRVDGEIRELDEPFSNGLMFPGDPDGGASEVVNCRCALLQRARWALDEEELETLKKRAKYFELDKAEDFADYKKKYLKATLSVSSSLNEGQKAIPYSERGIEIDERIKGYLGELNKEGKYIKVKSSETDIIDLAIMSTETGVEYTKISIGGYSYLIRGNEKHTVIPENLYNMMLKDHGTLDAHSHPYVGDLIPSADDLKIFDELTWQNESAIIEPNQQVVIFTRSGAKEKFVAKNIKDEQYFDSIWNEGD